MNRKNVIRCWGRSEWRLKRKNCKMAGSGCFYSLKNLNLAHYQKFQSETLPFSSYRAQAFCARVESDVRNTVTTQGATYGDGQTYDPTVKAESDAVTITIIDAAVDVAGIHGLRFVFSGSTVRLPEALSSVLTKAGSNDTEESVQPIGQLCASAKSARASSDPMTYCSAQNSHAAEIRPSFSSSSSTSSAPRATIIP